MSDPLAVHKLVDVSKKCRKERDLGNALHLLEVIRSNGLETHRSLGNHLVPMLVECGSITRAQEVFDSLTNRNVHAWTSLISGYVECGSSQLAWSLYTKMQESSIHPNSYTLLALLKACLDQKEVLEAHLEITEQGLERDIFVSSTLVNSYVKCGALAEADKVFKRMPSQNVVSWTALLAGYTDNGFFKKALSCYEQMQAQGLFSNDVTLVCVLKACGGLRARDKGQEVHRQTVEKDYMESLSIGCSLVDMYVKCEALVEAQYVFDKMPIQDVVSWNALINGYAEHGLGHEALSCFEEMQEGGFGLDSFTLVSVLKACSSLGAKDTGFVAHKEIILRFYEDDVYVGNTLVDMYAKSGLVVDAQKVFDDLKRRDVVSWNAMLKGYCANHQSTMAIQLFDRMQDNCAPPDSITFTSILSACSSDTNLALKGVAYFKLMITKHAIAPTLEHFTCLVGLLARSGHLCEAEKLLNSMAGSYCKEMWLALLSACKRCSELDLAFRCFHRFVQMEPKCSTPYMLMANLYANAGRQADACRIEALREMVKAK